jgi:hypothetical protein
MSDNEASRGACKRFQAIKRDPTTFRRNMG